MSVAEPLVSIAIPTRNQAEYITQTLVSAYAQTYPILEVVVCDDASTDDTAAVVDNFRSKLPAVQQEKLIYHRNPVRLKIGGNFDRAVRLTRGAYVVKVDSDDILEPMFVERLYRGLESHPEAGWGHCNVIKITPDKVPVRLAHARKSSGYTSASDLAKLYLRRSDTSHCVMLRREAYLKAGGYRPEMSTAQDVLLWIEMIMAGYGCYYSDYPLARMREYEERKIMSERRRDYVRSLRFMVDHLEKKWDEKVCSRLGLSKSEALRILRSSLCRTCLSLGLVEDDESTRDLLLDEANLLAQGLVRRGQVYLYRHVPPRVILHLNRFLGSPRRILRSLYIEITK